MNTNKLKIAAYTVSGILALTVPMQSVRAIDVSANVSANANVEIAQNGNGRNELRKTVQSTVKEMRKDFREEVKEKVASLNEGIKSFIGKRAGLYQVTLTGKTGTSLAGATFTGTTKDGKTITIHTDAKTQYRRRFWGKIESMDELSTGDLLVVIGAWEDDARTSIKAKLIRDLSIQMRNGVFFGTVMSSSANGWVISTKRGDETVTISSSTKLINRKEESIKQADIATGHRVRVRGLWDRKLNTITQVTEVKDFSLPVQVKATVSPSVTVTATATPKP